MTHEVYYPQVDTPNVQDPQFIVTDGSSFAGLERDATDHPMQWVDPSALIYRQLNTAKSGRYRITKTYLTDPDRSTLLVDTRFEALSGGLSQLAILYNPPLNNNGRRERKRCPCRSEGRQASGKPVRLRLHAGRHRPDVATKTFTLSLLGGRSQRERRLNAVAKA
jgi:GH15 family glucan-1,4-alpha-glucosidase